MQKVSLQYESFVPAKETTGAGQSEGPGFDPDVGGNGAFAPRRLSNDDSADIGGDDPLQGIGNEQSFSSHVLENESPMSYWSLKSATRQSLGAVLRDVALLALFSAGLMRTAIPSLFYAIISIQALYSGNCVSLKAVLPRIWVVLVACVALAMIISHAILNHISDSGFSPILLQVNCKCLVLLRLLNRASRSLVPVLLRSPHLAAHTCHSCRTLWPSPPRCCCLLLIF
jgi:hypothetical protein